MAIKVLLVWGFQLRTLLVHRPSLFVIGTTSRSSAYAAAVPANREDLQFVAARFHPWWGDLTYDPRLWEIPNDPERNAGSLWQAANSPLLEMLSGDVDVGADPEG